jgi:hypothetical protein
MLLLWVLFQTWSTQSGSVLEGMRVAQDDKTQLEDVGHDGLPDLEPEGGGMCEFRDEHKPRTAATEYDKFKSAFWQRYGITTKLKWLDTFMQKNGESGEIYVTRASTEVSSHLQESHKEIFGKTKTRPGGELELKAIKEAVVSNALREDLTPAEGRDNLYWYIDIARDGIVSNEVNFMEDSFHRISLNLFMYLVTTGVFQGVSKEASWKYAVELDEKFKDELYSDKNTLRFVQDKLVQFEKVITRSSIETPNNTQQPFIAFIIHNPDKSPKTPSFKVLYDTGAAVSLLPKAIESWRSGWLSG